jgi:MFS family permease
VYLAYSLVTIEFPTRREEFIGYCEAVIGCGLMIGPVLGGLIRGWVGNFMITFFIFGGIMGAGFFMVLILLP